MIAATGLVGQGTSEALLFSIVAVVAIVAVAPRDKLPDLVKLIRFLFGRGDKS